MSSFGGRSPVWQAESVRSKVRCSAPARFSRLRTTSCALGATPAPWQSIWKARLSLAPPKPPDPVFGAAHRRRSVDRELPPAALIPLAENGTPAFIRVAAEVMRRPRQITSLFGLARETRQALTALAGPARALRLAFAVI
jgi:hypothetical protein